MYLCGFEVGLDKPFFLIAGPCVIESRSIVLETATAIAEITRTLSIPFIFKASYDKANRTSAESFRGPGFAKGLEILAEVRERIGVPVLTDVHSPTEVHPVAEVVDVLQIPAFLCRQTDLIQTAAMSGKPINIKKGQFLAPDEMQYVVGKVRSVNPNAVVLVCERGTTFGYHNLVVDMRSLGLLRQTGCPVVFDATHSVQLPGAGKGSSSGQREFVPLLARAAIASGVSGLFMECHLNPQHALSDAANAWPISRLSELLQVLVAVDKTIKGYSGAFLENEWLLS